MTLGPKLHRLIWKLGRLGRRGFGGVVIGASLFFLRARLFSDLHKEGDWAALLAITILTLILLTKLIAGIRRMPTRVDSLGADIQAMRNTAADVELSALLVVMCYVLLQSTGGLHSLFAPLLYAVIAFVVAFHRPSVALLLVTIALVTEFLFCRAEHARPLQLGMRIGFIGLFALLHFLFVQAAMLKRRRDHRATLQGEIRALRQEARDFRLISSSLSADPSSRSRQADEERLAIGAVETIHLSLFYLLELMKKSLDLRSCILFWLDEAGEKLKVKELITDSDAIVGEALPIDAGAIGTVVKNRLLVNLTDPKPGHLPYYAAPEAIAAFVGVPLLEDGHLRGVLCADRLVQRPFSQSDEMLLVGAAAQMLRSLQSERVFSAVEKSKYEHERFFAALARLNKALTAAEVCHTTFEAAREICEFDFAAVTQFDRAAHRHTVVATVGEVPKGLDGLSFGDNAGLASMVVKNKHFLPAGGELRDKDVLVYTKKIRLLHMESLLVMPLICADEAMGSFALAAKRARAFTKDKREMLAVIANQVAVSLTNARLYGRMEEMATTDGLTGLVNHRSFQERFADTLLRSERSHCHQALLLTDIDHFKRVNDTHGHPVGDVVLRKVAQVVRDCVRKIDLAARYGGEEFAVVLEGTDLAGARLLAERIRLEVERQMFQSAQGPFSVTLSLGISVYPDESTDSKELIAQADQALYFAKHHGRNRAVAFADLSSPKLKAVK